jgi:hypothetical protein
MKYEVWFKGEIIDTVEPEGEPCAAERAVDYLDTFLDACVEQWCRVVKAKDAQGNLVRDHKFVNQRQWDEFTFDDSGPDAHAVLAAGGRWFEEAASGEQISILSKPCT